MPNTRSGIVTFKPFRRETNGLIRLERIRNLSTTMLHSLFSSWKWWRARYRGDHQNIRVSDVTVCDILDSDHLPVIFHILDHMKIRNLSEPIKKFIYWDRFQSLASELISPRVEISSGLEADTAVRHVTASIASAYRLATSKVTLSDINNDIPCLYPLLKHKRRLRKLWQETIDKACKRTVKWVTKSIRWITRKRALEQWGTKIGNTEAHPRLFGPLRNPS
jgi:hypothetical protein